MNVHCFVQSVHRSDMHTTSIANSEPWLTIKSEIELTIAIKHFLTCTPDKF